MPTDPLAALEAAAALGENATKRPLQLLTNGLLPYLQLVDSQHDSIGKLVKCEQPTAEYIVAAANLPLAAIAEELRAKDAEIERLRSDVQVLKNAAKAAFDNLLAQQNGGRLLRRDTVIGILGAALTPAAGADHA